MTRGAARFIMLIPELATLRLHYTATAKKGKPSTDDTKKGIGILPKG